MIPELKEDQEKRGGVHHTKHKSRPDEELYIAGEDLDLSFYENEIEATVWGWEKGYPVQEIAQALKRDPDEILILIIDLAKAKVIKPRARGIIGKGEDKP